MKLLLSGAEWEKLVEGQIIVPDGWDRTAGKFDEDWNRPISFSVFLSKSDQSTTDGFNSLSETTLLERVNRNLPKHLNIKNV